MGDKGFIDLIHGVCGKSAELSGWHRTGQEASNQILRCGILQCSLILQQIRLPCRISRPYFEDLYRRDG